MGSIEYMHFPEKEYRERYEKARELIKKRNLKGLFITEGANYTYFSGGTRDFSHSRPHTVLLPIHGEPTAIIQRFPEWNRRREIWFDDVRIYDSMLGLPVKMVAEAMKEKGMDEGAVGAELGYEQRLGISLMDFEKLKELLPKVEFIDAADIFWGVRMIKTPEEIQRHREACKITVNAYNKLFSEIREGMSEKEIVDVFLKLQANMGGTDPWAFINSSPENYGSIGGGPTNRKIKKGNQVWLDGGCLYKNYASDFCCAGTIGPPSEKQQKMQKMVLEITKAIVNSVHPGIKAYELNDINNTEWEKRGYDYSKINWGGGRIGHGLGNSSCLTEPPHIASYDKTEILPGMVFTIEPAINTEDGCFQTEMDIVVTANGCEVMNQMDWNLHIISS